MDHIQLAAVGTGPLAREFLCTCEEVGFAVHGIWSTENTRVQAARIARECGLDGVYSSFEELLKDEQVNTVYFSMTRQPYYDFAKEALKAGKHVLLEPEFTTCYEHARELYELARSNDCIIFEPITYRNAETWDLLKKSISKLGHIRLVHVSTSLLSTRIAESGFYEESGKGEGGEQPGLLKLNLRNLSFLMGLFGRPIHFDYYANKKNGVDTSGVMVLRYPGFLATAAASRDSLGINSFIIQGSHGFIRSPENPYSFHAFDVVMVSGAEHVVPLNHNNRKLGSELRLFRHMVKDKNVQLMAQRVEQKLEILEVLDIACRKVGISVPETRPEIVD